MMHLRQLARLLRITRIFVKHDLDEFVQTIHLFRPYRLLLRLLPWRWWRAAAAPRGDVQGGTSPGARGDAQGSASPGSRGTRERSAGSAIAPRGDVQGGTSPGARGSAIAPRGQRLREALEELGPVFVKFGQVLSTRPDLLPEDIALELARLQDQVPAFPEAVSVAIIERALNGRLEDFFSEFTRKPLASASVAQVHEAKLLDGTEVVVKVLRPGIEPVIERDLQLLYTLARLAVRYWAEGRRLRPVEVVDEFRKTLHDELDLRVEAANASQLRANFEGSSLLYVPRVYWDLVRRDVMVMERIHGIPISNLDELKRAGIDMRRLAHNGVEIFFTQAFRDGFFHADMHPGNIFVFPDGRYCAVDFGIMGSLSEQDKRYLAENFLAFFNRDYRGVAEAHLRSGWVPAGTRAEEFEAAIRTVCEPIFARPIKDISFGRFLLQLFQTARRFQMEIQPQLVLLQKTLFNIEGLGRRLYPELDLWATAKPYLERWMREQLGPRGLLKRLRREAPSWLPLLPQLPGLAYDTLRRAHNGELSMQWHSRELERLRAQLRNNHRRMYYTVTGGVLLLAGALVLGVPVLELAGWVSPPVIGWILGAVGVLLLIRSFPGKNL